MDENLHRLEQDVNAALGRLSDRLDVAVPPGVVDRARDAARHTMNEAWLAERVEARPSDEAVARARLAAHRALAAMDAERPPAWPARRLLIGVPLAAAAMIALAVGIAQFGRQADGPGVDGPFAGSSHDEADEQLMLFVRAAENVATTYAVSHDLLDEVELIEARLAAWSGETQEDLARLVDMIDEIDALLAQPESGEGSTLRHPAGRSGVLG